MAKTNRSQVVRQHFQRYFVDHTFRELTWNRGPSSAEYPRLRVMEFAPGPKMDCWTYATIGAWEVCKDLQLEFVLVGPAQDERHVELLFMMAWYHGQRGLGTGHTIPIGEPWLPGSTCDYFLLSRPYTFGEQLEICNFATDHAHVVWLLPITEAERNFKVREGQESLEERFDSHEIKYWDVTRPSVVE